MMEIATAQFPFDPTGGYDIDHYYHHQQYDSMVEEEPISSLLTQDYEEAELVPLNNSNSWEMRLMEIENDLFMDLTTSISTLDHSDKRAENCDQLTEEDEEEMATVSDGEVAATVPVTESAVEGSSPSLMDEDGEKTNISKLPSLLLMGAEAYEAENWLLCSSVIAELTQLLIHNNGNCPSSSSSSSIERLGCFFTHGLNIKTQKNLNGVNPPPHQLIIPPQTEPANSSVSTPAFHILQELSLYMKFGHFSANQAILEATFDYSDIHIVDFDINEGLQWPPLMADLTSRTSSPVSLKLTALILPCHLSNNNATVRQTGRRLKEYADSIHLSFQFDTIVMSNEGDLGNNIIRVVDPGRVLIANCVIHQLHSPNRNFTLIKTFLTGITNCSPKLVVLVEEELLNSSKFVPSMSFADFFCEAIDHYSAISESLAADGIKGKGLEMIEKELLGERIVNSVMQFPSGKDEKLEWGNGFVDSLRGGFKAVPFSATNVSQANYLVSLFSGGYWVQHERCRLALCWKSRPLATASIWVPKSAARQRKWLI